MRMNKEYFAHWHLGFFFWVFGLGIFSIPSFADIQEEMMGKTSFEYLLQKNNILLTQNQLLLTGMHYAVLLSLPQQEDPTTHFLMSQNRSFLTAKNDSIPSVYFSDDVKILRDAEFFVRLDVWAYLDTFTDRERGTAQYISWGKSLLQAIENANIQKDTRLDTINAEISAQKKLLSTASSSYSSAVSSGDSITIDKYKQAKAEIARQISLLESTKEELSKQTKSVNSYQKTIQQRVLGAEENKDALIKNVKIKIPSAEYINAVQE